jgi:hypothetical protein
VHGMHPSQSRAHVMHLHTKHACTRKGDTPMACYFTKMKEHADEMAAAGNQHEDGDIVSYILICPDTEYNGLVENVNSRTDLVSLSNLIAQLLATEAKIEK